MEFGLVESAAEFARTAEVFLHSEPFSANVLNVHVRDILDGRREPSPDCAWIVVEDGGTVVGAAMHTPPHHLFLPRLEDGVPEAIAAGLASADRMPPGVNGEAGTVARFAREWQARTGQVSTTRRSMRMYVLGGLLPPSGIAGHERPAEARHLELVADWFGQFRDETHDEPGEDPDESARRRISSGQLWLWTVHGHPVSIAGVSTAAAGVARVGPVYTPPQHRRHGYGAAVTSAASQAAINAGAADVVLYTDLANPTSNSIYQSIGYVPDHDVESRAFIG